MSAPAAATPPSPPLSEDPLFARIGFRGTLRPSQEDVVTIAKQKLREGADRLYVVAPPGSGKTVLGLYLFAHVVRRPTLVLAPNAAIQAQWAARADLFGLDPTDPAQVSMDPKRPALLSALTYQAVTLPKRASESLDARAVSLWQDRLVESGEAAGFEEATAWIDDLRRRNPGYHKKRLGTYRKAARDDLGREGRSMETLGQSALAAMERLRERGLGFIVLDECHHLLGHWGRVLADARPLFEGVITLGLTATPPGGDGADDRDADRYRAFFGPIDYEVPVPAVVKDGFLAPYQDLVAFCRPTARELAFVAGCDRDFRTLCEELCAEPIAEKKTKLGMRRRRRIPPAPAPADDSKAPADAPPTKKTVPLRPSEPLLRWVARALGERKVGAKAEATWAAYARRVPVFTDAGRRLLIARGRPLPAGVPSLTEAAPRTPEPPSELELFVPVLDRYVRRMLRRSKDPADQALAKRVVSRLRLLGIQITETGARACASPASRVLACSEAKTQAVVEILSAERRALGDKIRAVVVCDFERSSAVAAEIAGVLDAEAGGAVAAFRAILATERTNALDPILLTGSTVLIDDDIAKRVLEACRAWLSERGLMVELGLEEEDGFRVLQARGRDWCTRVYIEMLTELFQQGLTRCLVGTRGLLGEGWDANRTNVLVDLTAVTTSMSVNQLRGRSFRLDPTDPEKVANNWDVCCIAPELVRGLSDYHRFCKKHDQLFGVTDDGVIEKGVGHVHAAFTELAPKDVEGSVGVLNQEMLARAEQRAKVRAQWRIGEPYHPDPLPAVEVRLRPPATPGEDEGAALVSDLPPFAAVQTPWSEASLTLAIGESILGALREVGAIARGGALHAGERAGGYVRAFMAGATPTDARLFQKALCTALGPLGRPRYVIPRYVERIEGGWLARILPRILARYMTRRKRRLSMLHAVPDPLGKSKETVRILERHWNAYVSPGRAVYAYHGKGQRLVARARKKGQVPASVVRAKEVFL